MSGEKDGQRSYGEGAAFKRAAEPRADTTANSRPFFSSAPISVTGSPYPPGTAPIEGL